LTVTQYVFASAEKSHNILSIVFIELESPPRSVLTGSLFLRMLPKQVLCREMVMFREWDKLKYLNMLVL